MIFTQTEPSIIFLIRFNAEPRLLPINISTALLR